MGVLKKEIIKLVLVLILCLGVENAKATDIIIWHSLEGRLGAVFNDLVEKFNQTQAAAGTNNRMVPLFKGSYEQTLRLGLKALGTNEAPHILQVYDMGNWVMQAKAKDTLPLDKLTRSPSPLLNQNQFLPAIAAFYRSRTASQTQTASLSSLPFMAGSVVLFYNKDALQKADLNPDKPPLTWEEFERVSKQLKEKGAKNVLAAGWLSGHHIDQLAAWHNEPVATQGNGMDDKGADLSVNRPFFEFHLRKLIEWHRLKIFNLETGPQAEKVFAKGQVIFLTQGVNRLPQLERLVNNRFEIGVGPFPFWAQKLAAPYNTVPGGASFWVIKGHVETVYPVIQSFFEYLVSAPVQAEWHKQTGFMPVIIGAKGWGEKQDFYENDIHGQALKIGLNSLSKNSPKTYSRGILLPQFPKVREVMIQEMKEAIRGHKTPQAALDQIVIVGNKLMRED